jgi:hypothetical protein
MIIAVVFLSFFNDLRYRSVWPIRTGVHKAIKNKSHEKTKSFPIPY